MKPHPGYDPVEPLVTFESYVIPDDNIRAGGAFARHLPKLSAASLGIALVAALMSWQVAGIGPGAVAAEDDDPVEAVTRWDSGDFLSLSQVAVGPASTDLRLDVQAALQPPSVPVPRPLTEAERNAKSREALAILSRNKLRMLREGVRAGLYTVRAELDGNRVRLALETVNAEMTRATTGLVLRDAEVRDEMPLPPSLSTVPGEVDRNTLLFRLIQVSLANDGTPEGAMAAREMSRRAFAAMTASGPARQESRTYVVRPGDTLAGISVQFYGHPDAYPRIFEANRELLPSPDLIQTGQRLIIPG